MSEVFKGFKVLYYDQNFGLQFSFQLSKVEVINTSYTGISCNLYPAFSLITAIHDISKQIILNSARIGQIFARWHLPIAITSRISHLSRTVSQLEFMVTANSFPS